MTTRRRRRGARRRRRRGRRPRRDRDHQPARDRRRLGPATAASRCTARSSGRTAAPRSAATSSSARATRTLVRERTGLVIDPYFSGTKIEWLLRNADGLDGRRLRDDRLVARLQAHRPPRHRLHERLADAAVRHPQASPGTPSCASCSASTRSACPSRGRRPRSTARRRSSAARCRSPGSPATSRRRSSARPATAPGWPRTPTAPAASCCSTPAPRRPSPSEGLLTTVAWGLGGRDRLRARGGGLRHRRGGPMAARRARDHRRGGRDRGARRVAGVQRRRLLRARADRARLAALGPVRARHDRRADARVGRAHLARAALEAIAYQTVDAVRAQEAAVGRAARACCRPTAARSPTAG